jgi:hypothetical protein
MIYQNLLISSLLKNSELLNGTGNTVIFRGNSREKCEVLRIHFSKPPLKNSMDGVFQETIKLIICKSHQRVVTS